MARISGGCLCGSVRFSAESVEVHHHVCHCGMCRRWTGGSMLDDPTPYTLVREIFIDHKPGGYAFAGDLVAQTEAEVFAAYAASKGE